MKRSEKRKRKMMRAAAKAPTWLRDYVAKGSKVTGSAIERHKARRLGTFGAASPVRVLVKDGVPVVPDEASET